MRSVAGRTQVENQDLASHERCFSPQADALGWTGPGRDPRHGVRLTARGARRLAGVCALVVLAACGQPSGSRVGANADRLANGATPGSDPSIRSRNEASWGPPIAGHALADLLPASSQAQLRGSGNPDAAPSPGADAVNVVAAEWLLDEFDRRGAAARNALGKGWDGSPEQVRALGSLARSGLTADVVAPLYAILRTEHANSIAAFALLDLPRDESGDVTEPAVEGLAWDGVEDAIWERLAVSTDDDEAASLLFAIARVGGGRSSVRLSALLRASLAASAASASQDPAEGESAAEVHALTMQLGALEILCSRGYGSGGSLVQVIDLALASPHARVQAAGARGLARCLAANAEPFSDELVRSRTTTALAAILSRASASQAGSEAASQERDGFGDADEAARLAWRAFAALGEIPAQVPQETLARPAALWRVDVEAARALATTAQGRSFALEAVLRRPIEVYGDARVHVVLELLRSLRRHVHDDPAIVSAAMSLAARLRGERARAKGRSAKGLSLAICESEVLLGIKSGQWQAVESCADPASDDVTQSMLAAWVVDVLAAAPAPTHGADSGRVLSDANVTELLRRASLPASDRAVAALSALAEIDDPRVRDVLQTALASDDPGVLAAAAGAIAARAVDSGRRDPTLAPALADVIERRTGPLDIEARLAAIDALGALARPTVTAPDPGQLGADVPQGKGGALDESALWRGVAAAARDGHPAIAAAVRRAVAHSPALREQLATQQRGPSNLNFSLTTLLQRRDLFDVQGLRVETAAGSFDIDLRGAASPINQLNMLALAADGYFDGLAFHRVVPGFVVQGGDPRGDGYGGPGHLVPCEWSNLMYERGTVGMALAGKDTGGSQFFVTQSRQPHLDGRYTVLGHVSNGMDVVDQMLPGDRIVSVTLLRGDTATQSPATASEIPASPTR